MKTLPLTVLFHEGPMARAYLEMMSLEGYRVHTILRMVPKPGAIIRRLPGRLRLSVMTWRNEKLANHWPRVLADGFPQLCRNMTRQIEDAFDLGDGFVATLRDGRDIAAYAEVVHEVELSNLRDPRLLDHLKRHADNMILFTGGGIVPSPVFLIPGVRLLHVHPGCLPHVRGADGLLWSTLVRGRPGASAFIMAPGLDVGDLIEVVETEPLEFEIPNDEAPSDRDLYRMLFSFYDPVLRAQMLRRFLPMIAAGDVLTGTPQKVSEGQTYHFMDARLRHRALARLFRGRVSLEQ